MKKYSWVNVLIFAIALITVFFVISKNQDVRDVFMKSVNEFEFCIYRFADGVKNAFYGKL
ncbi:MAG: hypothetical protein IJX27_03905 [Clostridia bacterium]|nr:hypothetical protein [Clostridia bacterium]